MIARSGELAIRGSVLRIASELRRGEYFAGLFILGCVSGFTSSIIQSANRLGWTDGLFSTFEISVIIWISSIAGVCLILRDRTVGVSWPELALGAGFVLPGHSPNRATELDRGDRSLPLYPCLQGCGHFSTRCVHLIGDHCALALELFAVSLFCRPNLRFGCITC